MNLNKTKLQTESLYPNNKDVERVASFKRHGSVITEELD